MLVHHRLRLLAFPMRTRAARVTSAAGRPWDLPVPAQGASIHARVSDRAEETGARDNAPVHVAFREEQTVGSRGECFRGSMAGLYAPLPTLRRRPRGRPRTAWGRCGSLLLHRSGLSPHTPCQSPGALTRVTACTLALSPIRDTLIEGFSHFVTSMTAPIASGWSGCRVGLAPTGKRRLSTAHARMRSS